MAEIFDVLRIEKKYLMNILEAFALRGRLNNVLSRDYNGTHRGYTVRSLYFDSTNDNDYFAKEDGLNYRKKIRIRIYNTRQQTAKLELKEKQGISQRKRSLVITRDNAEDMIKSNYDFLLNINSELSKEIYAVMQAEGYKPKCVIEYDRIAFYNEMNNIRITFDAGVRTNDINFEIFDPDLVLYSAMNPVGEILEVKYNHFIPSYLKDIISMSDVTQISASKYEMSRHFGMTGEITI